MKLISFALWVSYLVLCRLAGSLAPLPIITRPPTRAIATTSLSAQHRRQERADSLRVNDPLISLNINLDALAEADAADRAQELYQRIEALYHEGYYPKSTDVVSFNSVMKAWARKKDPESALAFFSDAKVEPNLRSFNILLLSMAYAGLYEDAERVLQIMKEETLFVPDSISYNTLLLSYRYASRKDLATAASRAERLLDEMLQLDHIKVDATSWNTVLACVSRLGSDRATSFLRKILEHGVRPDLYTFSSIMQVVAKNGDVEQAEAIVDEMKAEGIPPNKFILTQLVQTYCNARRPDEAERVVQTMLASSTILPDCTTFSILIDGYAKIADQIPREAVQSCADILKKMKASSRKHSEMAPSEKTYTSMIVCLGRSRLWGACHRAKDLLQDFQPSVIHYNAVLDAYAVSPHADKSLYAYQLWREMPEYDSISYNILIKCASNALGKNRKWREQSLAIALKAYKELREHKSTNSLTYHYVLKAIRKCCFEDKKKVELFTAVFQHCCEEGMLSDQILESFVKSNAAAAQAILRDKYNVDLTVSDLPSAWSKKALRSSSSRKRRPILRGAPRRDSSE